MGCMKEFPVLFNIQVSSEHRSYLWLIKNNKVFQLHYGNPASKCVSVQRQMKLPSLCMQSNNVAVRLYNGMEVMFLMTVLSSKIKTANKKEAMLCSTWPKGWNCTGLCSFKVIFLLSLKMDYRAEGMEYTWHNIYLYHILWGRLHSTVQYYISETQKSFE